MSGIRLRMVARFLARWAYCAWAGGGLGWSVENWVSRAHAASELVWAPDHGPSVVSNVVVIPSDQTLMIQPGTVVKFTEAAGLLVEGRVEARGIEGEPIVFSAIEDSAIPETDGGRTGEKSSHRRWLGIVFNGPDRRSVLTHMEIRHAENAVDIGASHSVVALSHVRLQHNETAVRLSRAKARVEASNCLVTHNAQAFSFAADTTGLWRNCTIASNERLGSLNAAGIVSENTIIAFNQTGFAPDQPLEQLRLRHCLIYQPDGASPSWFVDDSFLTNRNTVSDPLFRNRMSGDFELGSGSPAVDAGMSGGAREFDLLERPRHDDPGVANRGVGILEYTDLGALERQQDSVAPDVAVVSVAAPAPTVLSSGHEVTMSWTIANVGAITLEAAQWEDRVLLSNDRFPSDDDLVLSVRGQQRRLLPGESYSDTLTTALPLEVSGVFYVVVQVDGEQLLQEHNTANNVKSADPTLSVAVPMLTTGQSVTNLLVSGEWTLFRVEDLSDESFGLRMDLIGGIGAPRVWVRRDLPPTFNDFDFLLSNSGGGASQLPEIAGGTHYVGVYADDLIPNEVNVVATLEPLEMSIRRVSPDRAGNAGRVTLKIEGAGFPAMPKIWLIGEADLAISGEVYRQSAAALWATFDLATAGTAPGLYRLEVAGSAFERVILDHALLVEVGGKTEFEAALELPGVFRAGRVLEIRVNYANLGSIDLPSPILTLAGGRPDGQWQAADHPRWFSGPEFQVLARGSEGRPTVLRPGQRESLTVRYEGPMNSESMELTLSSIGGVASDGSEELVDWVQVEQILRPGDLTDSEWEPIFAGLRSRLGETWGTVASRIRANAERWWTAGRRLAPMLPLLQMTLDEALGRPTGILAGRITESSMGNPVVGVEVGAVNEAIASAFTDDDGHFAIYGVGTGPGRLALEAYAIESGESFTMPSSGQLLGLAVTVNHTPRLHGFVVGGPGAEPVDSAIVVVDEVDGSYRAVLTADAGGRFELTTIPPGQYQLRAQSRPYSPTTRVVNVPADRAPVPIILHLDSGGTLSGTVKNSESTPISGAQVTVSGLTTASFREVETDTAGAFSASGLPPDTYTVTASAEGMATHSLTRELDAGAASTENHLVLNIGREIRGLLVRSEINPEPITNAFIQVFRGTNSVAYATNDLVGRFVVRGLSADDYTLSIDAPTAARTWVTNASTKVGDLDLTIPMAAPGSIVGSVIFPGGQTSGDFGAMALTRDTVPFPAFMAVVSGTNFIIPDLPPGIYDLGILYEGQINLVHEIHVPAYEQVQVGPVALRESESADAPTARSISRHNWAGDVLTAGYLVWAEYHLVTKFLPLMVLKFGSQDALLWTIFLGSEPENPAPMMYFADEDQLVEGSLAARGYRDSPLTDTALELFVVEAAGRVADKLAKGVYRCSSLRRPWTINILELSKPGERQFLEPKIEWGDPYEIPGNTAGGVGRGDVYDDTRRLTGQLTIFPSISVARVRSKLWLTVIDTVDLIPGDTGTGIEQIFTKPLSHLEYYGMAHDVPFTLVMNATPSGIDYSFDYICGLKGFRPPGVLDDRKFVDQRNVEAFEDKFGPAGADPSHTPYAEQKRHIRSGQVLTYRIEVANRPDAWPATVVEIYDELDSAVFDIDSVQLTRAGFMDHEIASPGGRSFEARVDLRPKKDVLVQITGRLDAPKGRIDWRFLSLDPATGQTQSEPEAGFLPPGESYSHADVAWVEFTVKHRANLPSGASLENRAYGRAAPDGPWGPAPPERPWRNTIDTGPPVSRVLPLALLSEQTPLTVKWEGQDDLGGSGIESFDIYVSTDAGPWTLWMAKTSLREAVFPASEGSRYAFYSVARDRLRQIEPKSPGAEATTVVNAGPPIPLLQIVPATEGKFLLRLHDRARGQYRIQFTPALHSPWTVFWEGAIPNNEPHVEIGPFVPDSAQSYFQAIRR